MELEPARVERAGNLLDALDRLRIAAGNDLVAADEHIDRAGAVAHGGDAVAGAVDLHHQPVLCDGVCRTDVERRVHGLVQQRGALGRFGLPMPQNLVTGRAQERFKPHLFGRHAAAEADGLPGGHIGEQVIRRFLRGFKDDGPKAAPAQRGGCFFEFFHDRIPPCCWFHSLYQLGEKEKRVLTKKAPRRRMERAG